MNLLQCDCLPLHFSNRLTYVPAASESHELLRYDAAPNTQSYGENL